MDEAFRPQLEHLVDTALANCKFARDWRNRHIGHRELSLALGEGAIPLAMASRQHVADALKAIAAVLNAVECHYCDAAPAYYDFVSHDDAEALLYLLRDGLEAREERLRRIKAREPLPTDSLRRRPL